MIFDLGAYETQLIGQLCEDLIEEDAVFSCALHNQGRRFPFETLPDRLNWVDTIGYNYVEISGTPGCRNPSRDYSQQYEVR